MQPDRAAAERDLAARRGDLCSARNPVGAGLRGEYYAKAGAAGDPLLVRTDARVDVEADAASPVGAARSVRWTGWIKPPLTGAYRFHLDVPGARITVARSVAMADGHAVPVPLDRGRYVPIVVVVPDLAAVGAARAALEWTAPHGARYAIPTVLLHLPGETVKQPS